MHLAKLGFAAAVIIATALALLWLLDILPQGQVATAAVWAFAGLLVLQVAAFLLQSVRGNPQQRDQTDRPVP